MKGCQALVARTDRISTLDFHVVQECLHGRVVQVLKPEATDPYPIGIGHEDQKQAQAVSITADCAGLQAFMARQILQKVMVHGCRKV
jgi:hypothetical protein